MNKRAQILIIGGGFAGLYAAKSLKHVEAEITLIDKHNHHLFQPLLYQVATASLSGTDIAAPIRRILSEQNNTRVLLSEAHSVDIQNKRVMLDDRQLAYDYLLLATGATHDYFGHTAWAQYAPGLKNIDDALEMRQRILLAYKRAEKDTDPVAQQKHLTFVIVGGGPTGVELAGSLAEISKYTFAREFRAFDPKQSRIILLDAAERLLPSFPETLSHKAMQKLTQLGVEVLVQSKVTQIDEIGVMVGDRLITAGTVLWAAGVQASPLARSLGVPLDRVGRVKVNRDLTIPGTPEVFVAGDLALFSENGQPVPGMASAAIQQGRHTAKNIKRALAGKPYLEFRYVDKGMLAAIGRASAVASFKKMKVSGFIAWCIWLLVHIYWLIGFRNRLTVMLTWAWAYLTYQRSSRIILTGESVEKRITITSHFSKP